MNPRTILIINKFALFIIKVSTEHQRSAKSNFTSVLVRT